MFLSKSPKEEGSITFGGYDLDLYAKAGKTDKDIFWADVSKQENYWTVSMNKASLNDQGGKTHLNGIKAKYAIMDTGVSYSLLPGNDFMILVEALNSYGVQCQ